jgi:hypothetical protein
MNDGRDQLIETAVDVGLAVTTLAIMRFMINTARVDPEVAFEKEMQGSFSGWSW